MIKAKYIQDPLYGYIKVDHLALSIIDTPEFDRLRDLKQLGYVHYVFPSATHNRFVHSLQVYHLARKWCKHLKLSKEYKKVISIAGLVHDIGHVVGCHSFDYLYCKKYNLPDHEERSILLFKNMVSKYSLNLDDKEVSLICSIVRGVPLEGYPNYIYQIVANHFNEFDVDKVYLKMDSYSLGHSLNLQEERIIMNSRIIDGDICFDEKVRLLIYEFYYRRFKEFKEIIQHHGCISSVDLLKESLEVLDQMFDFKNLFEDFGWTDLTDSVVLIYKTQKIFSDSKQRQNLNKLREISEKLSKRDWNKLYPYNVKEGQISLTVSLSGSAEHPLKRVLFYRKEDILKKFYIDAKEDSVTVNYERHTEKNSWRYK